MNRQAKFSFKPRTKTLSSKLPQLYLNNAKSIEIQDEMYFREQDDDYKEDNKIMFKKLNTIDRQSYFETEFRLQFKCSHFL